MKITVSNSPHEQAAFAIVRKLKKEGHKAYWVGGCIRNKLLNFPSEDIDIATDAPPEKVLSLFPKTISVGAKFGVVIVVQGNIRCEVATFRRDGSYLDHRHPSKVHFSDPQKDASRRDFTINALFWDPATGKLLDYTGGEKDIKKGIIRCIGKPEDRFQEDALRLLRAVRFSARFGFRIETKTWNAIKNLCDLIHSISPDRIREELIKIFTGPGRGVALDILEQSGLLESILPEVQNLKGVAQPEAFHPEGDCFEHTKLAMEWLDNPTPTLAMGCLFHDIGKPPTFEISDRIRFNGHTKVGELLADKICKRLKFSNAYRKAITDLVKRHMHFLSVRDMKISTLKKFLSHTNIEEDLELHRADCMASHGDISNYVFCKEKLKELKSHSNGIIPPPVVSGRDLIEMGYAPGPLFKKILDQVQELQLEGRIQTKKQAVSFIKKEFPL